MKKQQLHEALASVKESMTDEAIEGMVNSMLGE